MSLLACACQNLSVTFFFPTSYLAKATQSALIPEELEREFQITQPFTPNNFQFHNL